MRNFSVSRLKQLFPLSVKDTVTSTFIMGCIVALCAVLRLIDNDYGNNNIYVSMFFLLGVFMVSRFTTGYFYGTFTALFSTLAINYFFTYPYFTFNFTLSGYPLAICSTLSVSIITGTLLSRIKREELNKIEIEKEKTRANLLRAVSHDLRTPLTTISGSCSAIIENDSVISPETRLELLQQISSDAKWLIRMVENLLTVTRIGAENGACIQKNPEMVEEIIAEAVQRFKKNFPKYKVHVSVPNEALLVPMDAMLIEQVVMNLLENAATHSHGAPVIDVAVRRERDEAVFMVRDWGSGISEEILPNIFNGYFSQHYEAKGDAKRSMGIGLSVCSTIIKAHKGDITAYNASDKGAVFKFTLPITEVE